MGHCHISTSSLRSMVINNNSRWHCQYVGCHCWPLRRIGYATLPLAWPPLAHNICWHCYHWRSRHINKCYAIGYWLMLGYYHWLATPIHQFGHYVNMVNVGHGWWPHTRHYVSSLRSLALVIAIYHWLTGNNGHWLTWSYWHH